MSSENEFNGLMGDSEIEMKTEMKTETKVRRGKIIRGIKRTLSTAQFETLVIEIGFEEEIEWKTNTERQKKIENWNKVLIHEFKVSSDCILAGLGITHKKAYFKNPNEQTIAKYKHLAEAQSRGMDLDDDDLDSLDTLENANE